MYPNEALFQFPFVKGHAVMSAHENNTYCTYKFNHFNLKPITLLEEHECILLKKEIIYCYCREYHVMCSHCLHFFPHRWQCLFYRCAARREKACGSRSPHRTSSASLSGPSGTESRHLVNTKHMVLRQTGL